MCSLSTPHITTVFSYHLHEYTTAAKLYTVSLHLHPSDPMTLSNRAACYYKMKEYSLCIQVIIPYISHPTD